MFFENVNTMETLKKEYRRLSKLHHPDLGGDLETMKRVNAEHDRLFEILKRDQNARAAADVTGKTKATTETPEEFREVINILLHLEGLEVELCGSWLWIGGDTKANKDALKSAGCRWSKNKGMWYWHHEEEGRRYYRGTSSIGEIRRKYGSYTVKESGNVATA